MFSHEISRGSSLESERIYEIVVSMYRRGAESGNYAEDPEETFGRTL